MRQVHSSNEMVHGNYYLGYCNGKGGHPRQILLFKYLAGFTKGVRGFRIANAMWYDKADEQFSLIKLVECFDGTNEMSLAQYNIYGGVFELTEDEVIRHIVLEEI